MQMKTKVKQVRPIAFSALIIAVTLPGCAEGPLWQTGKYVPWARNQWAEEEKIAVSIFTKKDEMNQLVAAANGGTLDAKEAAAAKLKRTFENDPILLMRLHAVKLLGQLNCSTATKALRQASSDHDADIRIAAVQSWARMPGETAISELQGIIGSDTNIDVRLAATRALGNFHGQKAIEALGLALSDTDPALQLRAMESLASATGESLGGDVAAWQSCVQQTIGNGNQRDAGIESMASGDGESMFR